MGVTEKDHGGVVQGITEPLMRRMTKKTMLLPKGRNTAIEVAAEEEQAPGTPLPERTVKATPEQFGKFAQQKRR